nr:hypothetical protein [Paenibacillus terrae]
MLFLAGFVYIRLSKQIDAPAMEDTNGKGSLKLGYYLRELKEGYLFVKRHTFLRIMLPFFALTNFSMAILVIAMPSIAVSYGSPIYYSLLYVAYFIGIFVGSFLVSVLKKNGITIAVSWVAMGLAIYVFSLVPEMWMKLLAALLLGIFTGIINVLQTSLIQIITPLPLMGRVASFLNTLSSAALPLGALIGGAFLSGQCIEKERHHHCGLLGSHGAGDLRVFPCAGDVDEAAGRPVTRYFYRHHQCTANVLDSNYYPAAVNGTGGILSKHPVERSPAIRSLDWWCVSFTVCS